MTYRHSAGLAIAGLMIALALCAPVWAGSEKGCHPTKHERCA